MAHRDNQVEKIGLRGSHFHLGNNNPNPFVTTNSTTYNNQEKPKQMPNIKESNVKAAVEHDKQNLRASHFSLGTQDPKEFYYTTNSVQLKHYDKFDRAVLSEAQKKDLRSHHFQMGQYAPTTQTINNITYDKKPLVELKDMEKLKLFMRGHNHNFREMPNTIMTTKYNDDYNQKVEKEALTQGISAEQMKEKALALRHSHIILGKEHPQFQSVQKQDYTSKNNTYKPQTKDLQSSHFQLGNQKDSMCTTNDMFLGQQPIIKNPLAKETMDDLRSSHFHMGKDSVNYQTEFAGNFKLNPEARQKGVINTAQLQQNHFSLGNNNVKSTYQTVYKTQMTKPQAEEGQAQTRDQKTDRGSNFTIGNQGNSYTSEFTSSFKNQNGKPSVLNDAKLADLRKSHFKFNDIPQDTYQTNYKQSYLNRDIKDGRGQLEDSLKADLRANHFYLGAQGNNYQSTQHRVHHHLGKVQPGTLNERQKADLRTHHFKLG